MQRKKKLLEKQQCKKNEIYPSSLENKLNSSRVLCHKKNRVDVKKKKPDKNRLRGVRAKKTKMIFPHQQGDLVCVCFCVGFLSPLFLKKKKQTDFKAIYIATKKIKKSSYFSCLFSCFFSFFFLKIYFPFFLNFPLMIQENIKRFVSFFFVTSLLQWWWWPPKIVFLSFPPSFR